MNDMTPGYLDQESEHMSAWADKQRELNKPVSISRSWLLSVYVARHAEEIKTALYRQRQ